MFAILSPRGARAAVVATLVALQVLTDYLDTVSEAAVSEPLRNSLALHEALVDAVGPRPPQADGADYYRRHPQREDGGYVEALVAFCRTRLQALPALATVPAVAGGGRTTVRRRTELHACRDPRRGRRAGDVGDGLGARDRISLVGGGRGREQLRRDARARRVGGGSQDTPAEAARVDATYFLGVGSLTVLLDNLADRSADLEDGAHNYFGYYDSAEELDGVSPRSACRRRDRLAVPLVPPARGDPGRGSGLLPEHCGRTHGLRPRHPGAASRRGRAGGAARHGDDARAAGAPRGPRSGYCSWSPTRGQSPSATHGAPVAWALSNPSPPM